MSEPTWRMTAEEKRAAHQRAREERDAARETARRRQDRPHLDLLSCAEELLDVEKARLVLERARFGAALQQQERMDRLADLIESHPLFASLRAAQAAARDAELPREVLLMDTETGLGSTLLLTPTEEQEENWGITEQLWADVQGLGINADELEVCK